MESASEDVIGGPALDDLVGVGVFEERAALDKSLFLYARV